MAWEGHFKGGGGGIFPGTSAMYQSLYMYFYTILASSICFKYDCNTVITVCI